MKFADLRDDSTAALAKEVERLRLEVELHQRGLAVQEEADGPPGPP